MESKLYTILNDANIDLEAYERLDFKNIEKKN